MWCVSAVRRSSRRCVPARWQTAGPPAEIRRPVRGCLKGGPVSPARSKLFRDSFSAPRLPGQFHPRGPVASRRIAREPESHEWPDRMLQRARLNPGRRTVSHLDMRISEPSKVLPVGSSLKSCRHFADWRTPGASRRTPVHPGASRCSRGGRRPAPAAGRRCHRPLMQLAVYCCQDPPSILIWDRLCQRSPLPAELPRVT